ncbi:anaphase-promoting complex subunit [Histoplasma capsulatum var. duboisii H88]|uniref:Anaphase-promoting complex subunit 2 n=1 Tax=Ajellomyces capsulatus (strain H88) TaxID=544711 RepID=A0A8A1LSL2_AJEC8|nr:anaphase-promoting complex subunit [Histoplasma capsulatum var. duboisii H88]
MFQNIPLSISRKRVFDSVFLSAPLSSISPTPISSPVQSLTRAGGTFSSDRNQRELENVPEQVTWDRAWHAATTFLSIPDEGFRNNGGDDDDDGTRDEDTLLKRWAKGPPSQLVSESLFYVGADSSPGKALRQGSKEDDVKEWYLNEMRRHFLTNFRTFLVAGLKTRNQPDTLSKLVRYLRLIRSIYITTFLLYLSPLLDPADQKQSLARIQQNFRTIVTFALPSADISYLLSEELATQSLIILGVHNEEDEECTLENDSIADDGMDIDQIFTTSYSKWKNEPSPERRLQMISGENEEVTQTRNQLLHLLEGLQEVGLGGSNGQKIFAGVMNNILTEFVTSAYAGQWESPSLVDEHLRQWTEHVFARLVVRILHIFKTNDDGALPEERLDVTLGDVKRWQEMGIARLGALRISELFDVIVEWDSSSGAIEDLKHYTTNPATRLYLASSFVSMLIQRLLHPGASTVEILQMYISIIRAFSQLDPRGVLLNHVARPIRRYLRDRDDTVKVIVGGLLADTVDADGQPITSSSDTLVELAMELSKAHELLLQDDSGELDWDDMNWMPDPIDVATDYKKSKCSDVIGSLISLFDTKEAFVRELQKVLGERLLKKSENYDLEVSLLELLKLRFGDSALQACQVMLRDVQSSQRVDSSIRADKKLENADANMPDLHAKILSRLFWPTLQNPQFTVPPEIASLQQKYSDGFESLKQSRKLTWINGIGQVTVELDLEDRVFTAEVTTWQAAVIHAFQSPTPSPSQPFPVTKTVSELSQKLEMSPSLARSACLFWLSKRILTETQPDTFQVLEIIPGEEDKNGPPHVGGEAATVGPYSTGPRTTGVGGTLSTKISSADAVAAAEAAEEAATKESADAASMARMDLYWQFIVGMLTNQGAMPLQRIIMMLKIVVPGGFPFGSEELREFLSQMVAKGRLEVVSGGSYKIVA